MNREIKFRAFDKNNQVLVYDVIVYGDGAHVVFDTGTAVKYYGDKADDLEEGDGNGWLYLLSGFALMQYIGRKDKKGLEIYEGDIVNDCGQMYIVEWDAIQARYHLAIIYDEPPTGVRQTHEELKYYAYGLTVIGNIHQNPELLTKTFS